jgi:hypothetical protein
LLVCVLAIVVIMLVFGMSTYRAVQENFQPDKFTAQAQEAALRLQPMVQQKLVNAALDAVPTYRDLAQERLAKVLPQVRQNAQEVVTKLPQDFQDELVTLMKQSAERVAMQVKGDLKTTFPALADATKSEALLQHLGDSVDRETQAFLNHVTGIFEQEASRVSDVVLRFKVPPTQNADALQLQRQVIHRLLLLADYEVMAEDGLAEQLAPKEGQKVVPLSVE